MNGQQGGEQAGQSAQESHLSYLLHAANAQGGLMGYPGANLGQRFGGYGMTDASLEEQILQRASALRAEALMQQQQAHQRQHHLGAALAALQQQQQLSALTGLSPAHLAALSSQEQEALLGRSAALRELGISGGSGANMERLQQLELGRLEELERRRQQFAALAGYSGGAPAPRPGEVTSGGEQLSQDSMKSDSLPSKEKAPTVSAAEKSKEDLRKTPGTVIVPCRARGMPMDHNFKTAYFVISEDAKHGEDLVCSYFACRNGGVKFRYCAHCMAPVAKRNFCRRHDHGMSAKNGEIKDDDDDDASMDESYNNQNREDPVRVPSSKKVDKSPMGTSLDVLSKAASNSIVVNGDKPIPEKPAGGISNGDKPTNSKPVEEKPVVPEQSEIVLKRKKPSEEEEDVDNELANISKKRRKMWNALLVKRPRTKDPRHLSSWLNEVLTVSDFESPLDQVEIPSETSVAVPNGTPPKKHKADKENGEGPPSKKEKVSTNDKEKKKKKPDGDKVEAKVKKEKLEKVKEKKAKPLPKDKVVKVKEPAKKKEVSSEQVPKVSDVAKKEEVPKPPVASEDLSNQKRPLPESATPEDKQPKIEVKPTVEGAEKVIENKVKEKTPPSGEKNLATDISPETKSPKKPTSTDSSAKKSEEDGFVGSFADWRDRKKEKALKKGPGSLKK